MFDDRKNVRPLLFKNDNDDYPYSLGGTCFLFLYENMPYIITAKHCLKKQRYCLLDSSYRSLETDRRYLSVFLHFALSYFACLSR